MKDTLLSLLFSLLLGCAYSVSARLLSSVSLDFRWTAAPDQVDDMMGGKVIAVHLLISKQAFSDEQSGEDNVSWAESTGTRVQNLHEASIVYRMIGVAVHR